jgi:amino acid permease
MILGFLIITLGYCISTIIFMPMGLMNLDENIWLQFISFGVLVSLLAEFVIEFCLLGLHPENTPAVGDLSSVLGTVMFAFTFVVTIPSWCNEKRPGVVVNRVVWTSSSVSTCFYVILGLLGAWAYPNQTDSNILNVMSDVSEFCFFQINFVVIFNFVICFLI